MTAYHGFLKDVAGHIDNPHIVGIGIGMLASSLAAAGLFVIDLDLADLPLPQDLFKSVEIDGTGVILYTADASYEPTSQSWVWVGTGLHFALGVPYKLVFRI